MTTSDPADFGSLPAPPTLERLHGSVASSKATADDQYLVLVFYAVVDVSYSMEMSGALRTANSLIHEVVDALAGNPMLADLVRFGVIDFAEDAQVVLRPVDDPRSIQHLPELAARGATSYAAAFRRLRREIESDTAQLKSDGFKVYRPAVFFITDGAPTDDAKDIQAAFDELTAADFRARPNIIPFGVGGVAKDVVDPWVHGKGMRSFAAKEGSDPATSIAQIGEYLIGSILASANSVDEDGEAGGFVLPDDEELGDFI